MSYSSSALQNLYNSLLQKQAGAPDMDPHIAASRAAHTRSQFTSPSRSGYWSDYLQGMAEAPQTDYSGYSKDFNPNSGDMNGMIKNALAIGEIAPEAIPYLAMAQQPIHRPMRSGFSGIAEMFTPMIKGGNQHAYAKGEEMHKAYKQQEKDEKEYARKLLKMQQNIALKQAQFDFETNLEEQKHARKVTLANMNNAAKLRAAEIKAANSSKMDPAMKSYQTALGRQAAKGPGLLESIYGGTANFFVPGAYQSAQEKARAEMGLTQTGVGEGGGTIPNSQIKQPYLSHELEQTQKQLYSGDEEAKQAQLKKIQRMINSGDPEQEAQGMLLQKGYNKSQGRSGTGRVAAGLLKSLGVGAASGVDAAANLPRMGVKYFNPDYNYKDSTIAQRLNKSIDKRTDNYTAPENTSEQIAQKAAEWVTPIGATLAPLKLAGKASKLAKIGSAASKVTPVGAIAGAAGGAGSEAIRQKNPEGHMQQFIAGLAPSLIAGRGASAYAKHFKKAALPKAAQQELKFLDNAVDRAQAGEKIKNSASKDFLNTKDIFSDRYNNQNKILQSAQETAILKPKGIESTQEYQDILEELDASKSFKEKFSAQKARTAVPGVSEFIKEQKAFKTEKAYKKADEIYKKAGEGDLSFTELEKKRGDVGKLLQASKKTGGLENFLYSSLYGHLKDDLDTFAKKILKENPKALAERANLSKDYKQYAVHEKPIYEKLTINEEFLPASSTHTINETIANLKSDKEGSALKLATKNMPKPEKATVNMAIVKDLGMKEGDFDAKTLSENFLTLPPASQSQLLSELSKPQKDSFISSLKIIQSSKQLQHERVPESLKKSAINFVYSILPTPESVAENVAGIKKVRQILLKAKPDMSYRTLRELAKRAHHLKIDIRESDRQMYR